MAGHEVEARRPRSDKARNRTHILEVAEQFFAEEGVAGSMDAIAKRAGVGPGTLYRHFPSREALLAALMHARVEELTSRRDAIEQEQVDPAAALEQWLEALSEYLTAFDGLPEPLRLALAEEASPLAITCEGFITTTDHFLAAAQEAGGAQSWIRARDLFLGVLATAWARGAKLADTASAEALPTILRSGWAAPGK
jgi:AcrR family transcriptional regulator